MLVYVYNLNSSNIHTMNSYKTNTSEEIYKDPHIMLYLQGLEPISSFENFRVIDDISASNLGRPLIVISTEFTAEAATFLKSRIYKGVRILALVVSGEDDFDKADIIKDIAACTGASIIGTYNKIPPEDVGLDMCGGAHLVKINQDWDGNDSYNLIFKGNGTLDDIKKRTLEIAAGFPAYDMELFHNEDQKAYYHKLTDRINNFSEMARNYKFKCTKANRTVGHESPA